MKNLGGFFFDHYEFSFQLSGLSDCKMSGSYPVYVDKDNYVKKLNLMVSRVCWKWWL